MLTRWLLAGAGALALASNASAETYGDAAGTTIHGFAPVIGCSANGVCSGPVSATNPLPVTGAISASLSGFTPGGAYATPLAVSTNSANVALPAGTVVVVYNTGANAAYVKLGAAGVAATTANDVIPSGGWMAFTVGSNTYLGAITASGATSLNLSGGSGLPTGAGGGGAGGGGTVSQGTAASASGAWPTYLTQGGSALSSSNGIFVNPATGATFTIGGAVSISGTPNVAVTSEIGAGATGAAVPGGSQYAGMSVGGVLTGMTGTANGLKVEVANRPVGAAALSASQTTPGTSATLVVAARTGAAGTGRVAATLFNSGSLTVYIGASGVTTSTGLPLLPGASLTLNTTAAIYGVTSSGTGAIATVETY